MQRQLSRRNNSQPGIHAGRNVYLNSKHEFQEHEIKIIENIRPFLLSSKITDLDQ